jgi:hypothetical protein
MFSDIGPLFSLQRFLSTAQTIPLIGPVVFSPIKATVGVIEVIAGIILGSLSAVFGTLFLSEPLLKCAVKSIEIAGHGAISTAYAVGNFFSFGILGWGLENLGIQL